ncbi:MAG TPA: hypothetical protein VGO32_05625 [Candidatus Limnocylindria bacterium]|jgi:hypothetical protein|nr:hypothetical protein [Candidatus Limnocylindria bacterium]
MSTSVEPKTWRRYGFGGPPEPWPRDEQRDLDRLATSYYVDVLEFRRLALAEDQPPPEVEELFMLATRHKQELDYTLRYWATPAERARAEDRLGSLMRIARRLHDIAERVPGPA